MNKKLKELLQKMQGKIDEAKSNPENAENLMKEYETLKSEYETELKIHEAEKATAKLMEEKNPAPAQVEDKKISADEMVAKQVKALLRPYHYINDKDLSATTGADGGYTIPVDALTAINKYKETYASLEKEITVYSVTTQSGTRVFQTRGTPGAFSKLTSSGLSDTAGKVTNPTFEQLAYSIEDYAGFMPVPNNLIDDSDANIVNLVYQWLGKAMVDTDNDEILTLLGQKGTTPMNDWTELSGLDDIKKAVNVTLGQAFANTSKIYTNDDGAQYLATLKEKSDSNKPLLTPTITDSAKSQLSVGFRSLPVVILPNEVLKSVAPTTSATGKIPFIIGDLKEAIVKFDRKKLEIVASTTAVIGTSNAFAKNMTLFRGILRADYVVRDAKAVVKGFISTPKTAS